jgi:hypothetical protein
MLYELLFSWQARTALESLDPGERGEVTESIDRLRFGPNPTGLPQVYAIPGPENLHVMPAGRSQRLRVVFTVSAQGQITIQDILSHDLVRQYQKSVTP